MTPEEIEYYNKAAIAGTIPDAKNLIFLLQSVHPNLLVKILHRQLNVWEMAKHELQERGLDSQGNWVGFKEAERAMKKFKLPPKRKPQKKPGV